LFGIEHCANATVIETWKSSAASPPSSSIEPQQLINRRDSQLAAQLELANRADELELRALEMLERKFTVREKEVAFLKGWQLANVEWSERIDLTKSAEENAGALIKYAQRLKRARPKLEAQLKKDGGATGLTNQDGGSTQTRTPPRPTLDPLHRDLAKLERHGVKYLRYVTSDGLALLVGQSDRSNDELVRHYGSSRHLWLHVRDYPGSHVLLLTNGREVPQRSLEEAAIVAGYYSQGRGETDLDVSYTPVKQLRRPRGGKPGQVLKLSERVVRVNPMRFEQLRDRLRITSSAP
jgi:predicted ribosome quality control (RQC) complex YloA/Tae2 family protein